MTIPFTPYADLLERPVLVAAPLPERRAPYDAPRCKVCGRPFLSDRHIVCRDCQPGVALRLAALHLRDRQRSRDRRPL